jgi:hypothetical protein
MFGKNKSAPYGIEQATAELDAIIEKTSEAFVPADRLIDLMESRCTAIRRRQAISWPSEPRMRQSSMSHYRPAWLLAPQPRRRRRPLAGLWAAIRLLRSPVPAADHAHSAAQCGRAKTIPQADRRATRSAVPSRNPDRNGAS